jgi:hypothetical protein
MVLVAITDLSLECILLVFDDLGSIHGKFIYDPYYL